MIDRMHTLLEQKMISCKKRVADMSQKFEDTREGYKMARTALNIAQLELDLFEKEHNL